MEFIHKANSYYSDVAWTGSSPIHVSLAVSSSIPFNLDEAKKVMACFAKANYGQSLFRTLNRKFDNTEWLVSSEEFTTIFLTDLYRHLHSMADTQSATKLKNPNTGNVFHRIAIRDDLVCGIRFWVESSYDIGLGSSGLVFGWRFRIESANNEEQDEVRIRARDIVEEAEEMIEMVLDSFMEIKEPTKADMTKISAMEHELELL